MVGSSICSSLAGFFNVVKKYVYCPARVRAETDLIVSLYQLTGHCGREARCPCCDELFFEHHRYSSVYDVRKNQTHRYHFPADLRIRGHDTILETDG